MSLQPTPATADGYAGATLPTPVLLGLIVAAALIAAWCAWSSSRSRSGMAPRAAIRRTLGTSALSRGARELRPSLDDSGSAPRTPVAQELQR
jgi:hypothetical protein